MKFYIEVVLREPLIMMLEWEIGTRTGFDKSIGKAGKHLRKYLEPEVWAEIQQTYADADYDNTWESLFAFHRLFKRSAEFVGQEYGFRFPAEDVKKALAFLEHVRHLPEDAQSIF